MKNVSGRSGLSPKNEPSRLPKMLAPVLSALLLGSLLAGCAHNQLAPTAVTAKAQCAAWRRITYSKNDTLETIWQVQTHDQTGRNLRCWK